MRALTRSVALLSCSMIALPASATLLLDTAVNSRFGVSSTSTAGNDLPNAPARVYFGQLRATQTGVVDFFYIGNEAGYTNSFIVEGSTIVSVGADTFAAPYQIVDSLSVTAGQLLDYGFCTSGGVSVTGAGRCAYNNNANSLVRQFNYSGVGTGYRSIAYAALTGFNTSTVGSWTYANPLNGPTSNLWMMLWDDSGAQNDDNHDDLVVIARFRSVSVPEPGTLLLLGTGMLGVGAVSWRRRRTASAS